MTVEDLPPGSAQPPPTGGGDLGTDVASVLGQHAHLIRLFLKTTDKQWDSVVRRVATDLGKGHRCDDEQLWTFLLAAGFAAGGREGVALLTDALTDGQEDAAEHHVIWFEALPMPPRQRESNTNLDLAIGSIRRRGATEGAIEFDPRGDWLCFVEAKWLSDLSVRVTNDPERNQLARVIENAVTTQADGALAQRVHVTLLTPKRFAPNGDSRLYQFKYRQYMDDPSSLSKEILSCPLPVREEPGFVYPQDALERAAAVALHWVHYETLFELMDDFSSPVTEVIGEAHRQFNQTAR